MKRPEDYFDYPDRWQKAEGPIHISKIIGGYFEFLKDRREWLANPKEFCLKGDRDWYRDIYLNSIYWTRYVRPYMLRRADNSCERCGVRNVQLDVHHKTYERLGFELPEDLEVLCRDCHVDEHEEQYNKAPSARPYMARK